MSDPATLLEARVAEAMSRLDPRAADTDPQVRRSKVADYQVNVAFGLAKLLGRAPRAIAEELADLAELSDVCSSVEVAGGGYLNLTLRDEYLGEELHALLDDPLRGAAPARDPEILVIDYSAPNVAKEMHVGHLRSTVIGDALARILSFLGHRVIRQNHLGDWGTPFGMLIEHLADLGEDQAAEALSIGDLDGFYRDARKKFDGDESFADRARTRVVALQGGDAESLRLWGLLVSESRRYFSTIYELLGVTLSSDDYAGESTYNDDLETVVDELDAAGLLVEDAEAMCVFPPGFIGREGEPQPVIVRRRSGGFGYAATDLAAIRHRVLPPESGGLGATRLLYVVGAPQATHLAEIFAVAELVGWVRPPTRAEHVAFGSVLGADGKIFRTREGGTVKLADLLDEAVRRAAAVVAEKNPDLDADEQASVSRAIGIGAVKYADLSSDRVKDYTFDWDRMLALKGNSAPYLLFAHARVCSILRRPEAAGASLPFAITLETPEEHALGVELLAFDAAVQGAADRCQPHVVCTYLYELATAVSTFLEACPVLRAEGTTRDSRLALCRITAQTLATGLDLLGLEAPPRI